MLPAHAQNGAGFGVDTVRNNNSSSSGGGGTGRVHDNKLKKKEQERAASIGSAIKVALAGVSGPQRVDSAEEIALREKRTKLIDAQTQQVARQSKLQLATALLSTASNPSLEMDEVTRATLKRKAGEALLELANDL